MRWLLRTKHSIKAGETRVRTGFLFIPRCIGGECRWLEKACWQEIAYLGSALIGHRMMPNSVIKWRVQQWISR